MHSINYPAILHYRRVLGTENVMVVNSEDLSIRDMPRLRHTMDKVFEFLGLCPYEIPDMEATLLGKNTMPAAKELSRDGYKRLNTFFQPFHKALGDLMGWNLTHWDIRQPKKGLPDSFNGLGKNPEKTWFE